MQGDYFVLYARDRNGEKMKMAKGRMLYDRIRDFDSRQDAIAFGLTHLQSSPIVAQAVRTLEDYASDAEYVVAAYFPSKYQSYAMDGSSDPVPTHEVIRCGQGDLDAVVSALAEEDPSRMYLGIELTLMPTALDRIRSINR